MTSTTIRGADDNFASVFGTDPIKAPAAPIGRTTDYFQYIPADIEALSSGGSKRGLVTTGGVIVLSLLNLIAVVFLIIGLMG